MRAMLVHIETHHGETHKLLVPVAAKRVLEEGISGKEQMLQEGRNRAGEEEAWLKVNGNKYMATL